MFYFAYGSNLCSRRLQQRVSSAQLLSTGQLPQHQLLFHKIGRDGSAKCNAYYTGIEANVLHGAVYKIDSGQKDHLDKAEGLGKGYEIKNVKVLVDGSRHVEAFTYFATRIATDITPFHWYKEHVLAGALEHSFPDHYISQIASVDVVQDHDEQRAAKELAIYRSF